MSNKIQAELQEQLLKALANIENVVFSSDDYDIEDISFQVKPYGVGNSLSVVLDIELHNKPKLCTEKVVVEND